MKKARIGFTIIEMMIVIVIIAILSGFVFRMMTLASQKNNLADTKARLEKIANAIEAYRGEYGSYPPVAVYKCLDGHSIQPIFYEFPGPTDEQEFTPQVAAQMVNDAKKENYWEKNTVFTFGLASYLYPRYWDTASISPMEFFDGIGLDRVKKGEKARKDKIFNQWGSHNDKRGDKVKIQDMDKDMNALRRILPLLETHVDYTIDKNSGQKIWAIKKYDNGEIDCGVGNFFYVSRDAAIWYDKDGNEVTTGSRFDVPPSYTMRYYKGSAYACYAISFQDLWGKQLHYQSNPPYDSYCLWSAGPDGRTCDPICGDPKTCSACRDNIYIGLE